MCYNKHMVTFTEKLKFITACFGEPHVARDGENIAVKCPKCGKGSEKKKLSINSENGKVHCWVCGLKGNNLYYIIRKFVSNEMAKDYVIKFGIRNIHVIEDSESEEEIKIQLPSTFKLLGTSLRSRDPDIKDCLRYLKKRYISELDLWRYKIGTCVNGIGRRRIFFPSFNINQGLNYYVSRAIDEDVKPKYLNAKVNKTQIIFDEFRLDFDNQLTIVEGVFDMMKCGGNTVPILGSSLRPGYALFDKIVENNTPIVLALDNDVKDKTHKIASNLKEYAIDVKILDTSGYDDIATMPEQVFRQRLNQTHNYSESERLFYLISKINSGSMF